MHPSSLRGAFCAVACLLASAAQAHVTLETSTAEPNTIYRAVLRVGHGCAGAATTALSVAIPEGVIGARPMPKAGWTLSMEKGAYARTYRLYGEDLSSGAKTITWTGGQLGDDQYDEFVFVGRITDAFAPGSDVAFPVVQTCGRTASRWTEIPAAGHDAHSLRYPAPMLRIVAADAAPTDATSHAGQDHAGHDMSAHDHAAHDMPMSATNAPADSAAGAPPAMAAAAPVKAGTLTIDAPWMRATPGGASVAGGYLRVTNGGDEPDRLLAASVSIAGRGEVHQMTMEGGVMKMAPVEGGLVVPPHGSVELKPGGYHLMFLDLREAAKAGTTLSGTLTFERAGTVPVMFGVGGLGAQSAPAPAKP